jgi:hypothetical protein
MRVRWDETVQAAPHRQIVNFAEFFATVGIFGYWVQSCPSTSGGSDMSAQPTQRPDVKL